MTRFDAFRHAVSQPHPGPAAPAFYARSLSRRALLRGAIGSACVWAAPALAKEARPDAILRERIAAAIAAYAAQGDHRTGSDVDARGALWLARELAARGLDAVLERFLLERFVPGRAQLVIGGAPYEGVPAFDGGTTGPDGVRGRLGALGSGAEIGIARVAPITRGAAWDAFEAARRGGTHRALVVFPERGAAQAELALINAERFSEPGGVPVLQLAGAHAEAVEGAAARGEAATLVVQGERVPGQAINVTARLAGREPALAPLVVMTPRSGWFACASERGGGIAAWLEIAAALRAAPARRPVVFIASSGHELGHLGLRAFLVAHPDLAAGAHAWLHLGANFAAQGGPAEAPVLLQASQPEYVKLAQGALRAAGQAADQVAPAGAPPLGEAREIAARPYISLLGGSPRFHTASDRWPDAVDLGKAARLAQGLAAIAQRLTG